MTDKIGNVEGRMYRVPLLLTPQPEGGYTVTSPHVPGLVTEGETEAECLANAWDALLCLLEGYEDLGRPTPLGLPSRPDPRTVRFVPLVASE